METVISSLLELDKQAQQIVDDAKQYYDQTIGELESRKQVLQQEYQTRADTYLQKVENTESKAVQEAVQHIAQDYRGRRTEMDRVVADNRQAWIDELCRRCLKGGGE